MRAGEYAPSPRRSYDREADAVVRGAAVPLGSGSVVVPSARLVPAVTTEPATVDCEAHVAPRWAIARSLRERSSLPATARAPAGHAGAGTEFRQGAS